MEWPSLDARCPQSRRVLRASAFSSRLPNNGSLDDAKITLLKKIYNKSLPSARAHQHLVCRDEQAQEANKMTELHHVCTPWPARARLLPSMADLQRAPCLRRLVEETIAPIVVAPICVRRRTEVLAHFLTTVGGFVCRGSRLRGSII